MHTGMAFSPTKGGCRRARSGALAIALIALALACAPARADSWAPEPVDLDGLTALAHTEGQRLLLHTAGGDRDFLPGVNLGATVPGHAPGELATARSDYRRWFPLMADLGLRAVRVYTIHPPHFYTELAAYNAAHPAAPLYLIQGVWIPEERFGETRNLYDPGVRDEFRRELSRAVAVVHGDAELHARPGHASGTYTADVSPWLAAWAPGVEWEPQATLASDEANRDRTPFAGRYVTAGPAATPTESWLAEMLDHLAGEQAARGRTVPMTFSNWPTTDPLHHPGEPQPKEDLVSVDANNVRATAAWPGGLFASYHAYPYYPDFQRYEAGIADHVHDGRVDPYAGYLTALRDHHAGMPLMVTEYGVPSSLGSAHSGPLGRDQGGHGEREQMAINADLLRVIADLDLAGGVVFAWTDEWFKATWNTIDLEVPPQRRALWKNPWTNEQHFGLLAHDPGVEPSPLVGGDPQAWAGRSQAIHEGRGAVREVRAAHDEAYLYLRIVLDDADRRDQLAVDVDVLPGTAAQPDPARDPAAERAVTLPVTGDGQAWVRSGDGWQPQRLLTNRPSTHPLTGAPLPAEEFEVGRLRRGSADPSDPAYDSRALWHADGAAVTLRLPWATLGFADPSSHQALRPQGAGQPAAPATATVDRIGLSIAVGGQRFATAGYAWSGWQRPTWHERPKAGLDVFAEAVAEVSG